MYDININDKILCILSGLFNELSVAEAVVKYLFMHLFLGVTTNATENFVGGKHRANRRF